MAASTQTMWTTKNLSLTEQINIVKQRTKEFLVDRKNANNLVDIMTLFEAEENDVVLACIKSLHKIFCALINQKEMYMEKAPLDEDDIKESTAEEKYKLWLRDRYRDCQTRLLELLSDPSSNIQELALCTLMKFIEAEGNTPLKKISAKHLTFPGAVFEQVVLHLLSSEVDLGPLIVRFQEFLEYDDIRYFTMKHTLKQLKDKQIKEAMPVYLGNVLNLLEQLSMPQPPEEDKLTSFLAMPSDTDRSLKLNTYKEHKKMFTTVWLEFLKKKLSSGLYKKVLLNIHEKVLPYMTSPLLLSDFLTESYNIGGAVSLLALNGLFILIHKYNLDYPDFYQKLYALFEPSVFHVKYRARFFFLADLFLTSTHLPSYLVAAFAKKLARIGLTAPPSGLTVIIPFIYNLIIRHPNCQVLLHRPDGPSDVTSDPFKMDEPDPSKCNALDSCLWELKTLQNHYDPSIAKEARKMEHPLPTKQEIDLSELLETTTDDLFTREIKKKVKTMPTTFECPKGIFGNKEDRLKEFWLLD